MTQTVIPQLRIMNASRSLAFYTEGLGFAVDWKHQFESGFPLFLQLTRAGQTIFLTEHTGDCQLGGAVYFRVPDVDACYRDFGLRGISVKSPEDTAWGTREMVVVDPDGNRLRFATHGLLHNGKKLVDSFGCWKRVQSYIRHLWWARSGPCRHGICSHGANRYERLASSRIEPESRGEG